MSCICWFCRLPAAFLASLLVVGCGGAPAGDSERGGRIFVLMHCGGCHGENGAGGRAPALAGGGMCHHQFSKKLRNPGSAGMPAFGSDRLSDQDMADLYAWLQTLPGPPP